MQKEWEFLSELIKLDSIKIGINLSEKSIKTSFRILDYFETTWSNNFDFTSDLRYLYFDLKNYINISKDLAGSKYSTYLEDYVELHISRDSYKVYEPPRIIDDGDGNYIIKTFLPYSDSSGLLDLKKLYLDFERGRYGDWMNVFRNNTVPPTEFLSKKYAILYMQLVGFSGTDEFNTSIQKALKNL